ncbi:hypothetical protein [Allisonella histaminiformans]|uniref:hypothetical protein n=1 Tax=Allisonella histaminiformans TaxID=209880 RepID=UPI003F88EC09
MVDDLRDKDRKNAKASQMGGVQHVSRSGEKGWTVRFSEWGKVDCCMLEQRENIVKALSIIYLYTGYLQGKWGKGEFICQSIFMESLRRKIMLDIFVRQ